MEDQSIDLQTAAERLGVHYQTAYRWVRSGELEAARVRGRYLLHPDHVEAFAAQRERPTPPKPRRPRDGFGPLADRMYGHLVTGDESAARRQVADLVGDGVSLTTVIQELLVPALRRIGVEWHAGRLTIWVEHQAAAIVDRIIGSHHPNPRGRRRGTAVVAAVSGDLHVLPTSMAAAALREDNWRVHHLGADMPGDEIMRFCAETPVDLAVLTSTASEARPLVEHTAAALESQGTRTLVGEPGRTLDELLELARAR
ncbi:MAG: helix-turn-helix domain-containing protein [Ilumatobacter sp.]|nr:MAG: helix-turn-helix domain-containing protein [Ilumatobacter sp.]